MRIPMNQSNIYNQYIIMHLSKSSSNQGLQIKSLLITPQDTLQTSRRKPSANLIHCRQKIHP